MTPSPRLVTSVALAAAALVVVILTACAGGSASAPTPTGSLTPGGGADAAGGQPFDLDPTSPRCNPADATTFGVVATKLPAHWPSDVPVIPGTCFASSELADSTGGYALEVSVALSGTDVDFDNYAPWQTANQWLADAGMEKITEDVVAGGGRESVFRQGLVTSSLGDDFYHYELRVVAQETDDGYVVIQYLLNLLIV